MSKRLLLFHSIRRWLTGSTGWPARRSGEVFPLLFDPRTPVLFVLSGLLLAVMGNAAYGLLLLWWGEGLWGMLGALLGALVLLVLVVAGLYAVLRAGRPRPIVLGSEEEAEPRRGLVLFLSPGKGKADETALQFHRSVLQRVWLIDTAEVAEKAGRLVQELHQQGVEVTRLDLRSPRDAGASYHLVREALRQAAGQGLGPGDLYVDITSSLRPAAVGATLAALEGGYEIEYVVAEYDRAGRAIGETSRVMKVRVRPAQPPAGGTG